MAVVVRNQNREGNWQANLNVGPFFFFSFFNVVAKAIRRKEKKEETYGHVENEILYMLMKTERGEKKKNRKELKFFVSFFLTCEGLHRGERR